MQYYHESDRIFIAAATIDDSAAPIPKPTQDIFLDEMVSWATVPDEQVERVGRRPAADQKRLEEWWKAHGKQVKKQSSRE